MSSRRRRRSLALLVAALSTVFPGLSAAQPSPAAAGQRPSPAPPPPPSLTLRQEDSPGGAGDAAAPPPPPPAPRRELPAAGRAQLLPAAPSAESAPAGAFVHDGFYLRLALGGAYGTTSVKTDRVSQPDVRLTGFGGAFDLWCGWSLASGVVLGPALSVMSQRADRASIDGAPATTGVATSALLGAFVDAYPNPGRGEHFGGMLSLASLTQTTADGKTATDFDGAGVGVAAFVGYDAWIARQWSLGALVRVGGTVTRGSQRIDEQSVEKQATSYGAALVVTLVYQ